MNRREIVVYLSYDNDDPRALAEALVEALDTAPIAAGQNPLSRGVELRFHYSADLLKSIQTWLDEAKPHMPKGPTGVGVRTFVRLAESW